MNKLIFASVVFTQYLFSFEPIAPVKYEWTPTCYWGLDIDKECIFYDAYNDVIEVGTPRIYMEIMYEIGLPVVISHFMPMPDRPLLIRPIKECA